MSSARGSEPIDDVAPGDVITLHRSGLAEEPYRVVHVDRTDTGYLVTLATDDGVTLDVDLPPGTLVVRALESKWEPPQSPTGHAES